MAAFEALDRARHASPELAFLEGFHGALSTAGPRSCVLFSGGLDSSLVAHCLSHLGARPVLRTIGLAGAPDLAAGEEGGRLLGLPWSGTVIDPEELAGRPSRDLPGAPSDAPPLRVALELAIRASDAAVTYCGQGADELFGGYAHFRDLSATAAEERRRLDLHRLEHTDWPWTFERALALGRVLRAPFLDWEVRRAALRLPPSEWHRAGEPKGWLRDVAERHGLPAALTRRPKRALQYGSGIARALHRVPQRPSVEADRARVSDRIGK